ncbi:MAG: ABC transporter permease [Eubacteriales bacterium]|nr:ABC transporter permease [Eubacteriales bacterium]
MNSFKISLKNIKKSWKDYSVYFMTLIIGVAIFYMFNSIGHQKFMEDLSSSGSEIVKLLTSVIEGVSIAVAFVLGLLMVYANHFLIKRRKKEFGVYMMLGMGKNTISKIIMGETLIVGAISLVAGIVFGIFGSQFLSILVGKMFLADVTKYTFLFSGKAMLKTIINFAIIYLVVLIFNTAIISKYRLIDLLNAGKKGEKHILKNPVVCVILFVISALVLGNAYYHVGIDAENLGRSQFLVQLLCGIVATFLLFWSLAGFLLEAFKKTKGLYFKGLHSFVVRQFCSNINSSAFAMAVISLMLFMAMSAFSLGFSIRNKLNEDLEKKVPVDVTLEYDKGKLTKLFKKKGYSVDTWLQDDYVQVKLYKNKKITIADTLGSIMTVAKEQFPYAKWNLPATVMKLSDYNKIAELYGVEKLSLGQSEYAMLCDIRMIKELMDQAIAEENTLEVGKYSLTSAYDECQNVFLVMSFTSSNMGIVVLPDEVVEDSATKFKSNGYFLAGNYMETGRKAKREIDKKVDEIAKPLSETDWTASNVELAPMTYATRNAVLDSSSGLSVLSVFLVLYIGLVFIISSAAILALKALSDAIDSTTKYEILSKIGAGKNMMTKALFTQTLVHFGLPLLVAVVHSVFGLMFAKTTLAIMELDSMFSGVGSTVVIMLLVYGGYMMATYFGCRRVINID